MSMWIVVSGLAVFWGVVICKVTDDHPDLTWRKVLDEWKRAQADAPVANLAATIGLLGFISLAIAGSVLAIRWAR